MKIKFISLPKKKISHPQRFSKVIFHFQRLKRTFPLDTTAVLIIHLYSQYTEMEIRLKTTVQSRLAVHWNRRRKVTAYLMPNIQYVAYKYFFFFKHTCQEYFAKLVLYTTTQNMVLFNLQIKTEWAAGIWQLPKRHHRRSSWAAHYIFGQRNTLCFIQYNPYIV